MIATPIATPIATLPAALAAICFACISTVALATAPAPEPHPEPHPEKAYVLDHEAKRIDGTTERLAEEYEGKVLLIVNVASKCGLTPQYKDLEALYRKHKEQGLVVMGFPANDFGRQEPGTNKEILEFCTGNFDVTFPMFEKITVKGDEKHPLYEDLTGQPEPIGGDPRWNFTKFLVARDGTVVARFSPRDQPMDEKVVEAIRAELAKPAPAPSADS